MPVNIGSPPPLPSNLLYSGTGALNQAVNMTTDGVKGYFIVFAGTAGSMTLEVNADATATNYYRQTCTGQGASAGATNSNSNAIENAGGSYCHGFFYVLLDVTTNQRITAVGEIVMNATTSMKLTSFGLYNTTAQTNITNIKFTTYSGKWWIYGVKN